LCIARFCNAFVGQIGRQDVRGELCGDALGPGKAAGPSGAAEKRAYLVGFFQRGLGMSETHRHPGTRSCSVWVWLRSAYGWSPCSAGRRRWPSAWSWAVRWENGLPGGLTSGWAGAPRLRVWILRGPVCGREPRRNFLRGSRFFFTLPRRPPSCPYRSYKQTRCTSLRQLRQPPARQGPSAFQRDIPVSH